MSSTPKLLIIDDDEIVLTALSQTLEFEGYTVLTTTNPNEAIQLAQIHSIAAVIADQIVPGIAGVELLEKMHQTQPHVARILITGALCTSTLVKAVNTAQAFRIISKPWTREELVAHVQAAVQHHQALVSEQNASGSSLTCVLEFCQNLLTAYNPWIGKEMRAIVSLCEQMIATGLVPQRDVDLLRIAAHTHNLGLIGISRTLFSKSRTHPDELTENEKELLHSHPERSAELIACIPQLSIAQPVVQAHHEYWNGTGYPLELSEQMIPLASRLLAVAVAYVECGLAKDTALQYIIENSACLFDPEAVRLFFKATQLAPLPHHLQEVLVAELTPGMRLARDLNTPVGLLIVPAENTLDVDTLEKVLKHDQAEPLQNRILVYK